MDDSHHVLVNTQYAELSEIYSGLALERREEGLAIKGLLDFSATYEERRIQDSFEVEILIPENYPKTLPVAKEIGGRIPRAFHKNDDESLCLGAPADIKIKFSEKPSLLGFIENLLIPFLFSFSCSEQNGSLPYGELSHGGKGLVEYYNDFFGVNDEVAVLGFLKILASDNYRGHQECPCRSGRKVRQCHGDVLLRLKTIQRPDEYLFEYLSVLAHIRSTGKEFSRKLIDERARALIRKGIKQYSGKKD